VFRNILVHHVVTHLSTCVCRFNSYASNHCSLCLALVQKWYTCRLLGAISFFLEILL
jgi:hypothetical protein